MEEKGERHQANGQSAQNVSLEFWCGYKLSIFFLTAVSQALKSEVYTHYCEIFKYIPMKYIYTHAVT